MIEAGVGSFEFSPWWGAFVPAGTPQPIVAKLGAWMNQIARTEETRQFLERIARFNAKPREHPHPAGPPVLIQAFKRPAQE